VASAVENKVKETSQAVTTVVSEKTAEKLASLKRTLFLRNEME
jgi:hypothetical protein